MRNLMWTALAAGLLLAGVSAGWADDVVRLGGPGVQEDIQGGTDTELIRGYYRGGYRGGYYGGGRYYGGYYGARNWGGGGYYGARYWGGGYYRPYYYSSFYYRPYYYTPAYYQPYYYNDCYYSPIMGDSAPLTTLQGANYQPPAPQPLGPKGDGTFPYNGGPAQPIPMPNPSKDLKPSSSPRGPVPLDGRLVTLPTQTSGAASSVVTPDIQRLRYVNSPTPTRVTYPAYGEEPIPPAPRKTSGR